MAEGGILLLTLERELNTRNKHQLQRDGYNFARARSNIRGFAVCCFEVLVCVKWIPVTIKVVCVWHAEKLWYTKAFLDAEFINVKVGFWSLNVQILKYF